MKQIQEDCGRWGGFDIPLGNYPDSVPGKSPHLLCGKKQGNNIPTRPFRSCKTQSEQPGGCRVLSGFLQPWPLSLECDVSIGLAPGDEVPSVVKIFMMLITKPNVQTAEKINQEMFAVKKSMRSLFWVARKRNQEVVVESERRNMFLLTAP